MTLPIRRLGPEDAAAYRAFRLEMLEDSPEAFSDSLEEAVARSDDSWRSALSGERAFFGGFAGKALVGSVDFLRETAQKSRHRGWLLGMYVAPGARGKGLGSALVETVLAHARVRVLQVHLGVGTGNEAAKRLYRRAGFEYCGTTPRSLFVGGSFIDEHQMVCFLDKDGTNE